MHGSLRKEVSFQTSAMDEVALVKLVIHSDHDTARIWADDEQEKIASVWRWEFATCNSITAENKIKQKYVVVKSYLGIGKWEWLKDRKG